MSHPLLEQGYKCTDVSKASESLKHFKKTKEEEEYTI